MPTSLTKSSLSLSWTENPARSWQRSKSDSSWASRSLPARCRRGSWLTLGCVFMASKLAPSGDGRVEELSAPPTFSLSETGLFIISYYGLPCRLQRALEEAQMARFVISPHFRDRKSTRLNSSHSSISYAVFCLKKKNNITYSSYKDTAS